MPKFRKKPVVIEAVQLPEDTFTGQFTEVADNQIRFEDVLSVFAPQHYEDWKWRGGKNPGIIIPTREGDHLASPGDWIIKGVQGEFYPCKPDIFAATYEAVE